MGITVVYDATHANIAALPPNSNVAGYVTGSSDIAWTPEDFRAHPEAVRIDQSPSSTVWDATADVDDYESGAVALSELAPRAKLRMSSFKAGTRLGQREPLVYASANNITNVANALVNGGVISGVGLWVANWNLTEPQAITDVISASGPFPIRGVQFHNAGQYDVSVFDSAWLANTSGKVRVKPSVIMSGFQFGWKFCDKCSALCHNTGPMTCPAGGTHDLSRSHNYGITWDDSVTQSLSYRYLSTWGRVWPLPDPT